MHSRTGTWFSETFISASADAEALNVIARTAQLALDLVVISSLADRFLVEAHPFPRAGSPSIHVVVSLVNLCHGPAGWKLNVLTSMQRFPNIGRNGDRQANRVAEEVHAFHAVARLGSVTRAAAELHLSQSAVSIQIGELEASIGAPLVRRTGHGARLTEAGQVLQNYADRMLNLWTEASNEMASFVGQFSGILRVGSVTTAEFWLPRLLVTFVSENPRVKIKLQVGKRDEIVSGLAAAVFDIAVMGQPPEELAVNASGFAKNPVGFLAAIGFTSRCA